ncbi:ensconsin isoform X10 [Rhipicephalus sanguineus]|uniref:ensconsin isoform X10 n=1 Tax=Rhipicephalus sanguineus TaxID=34632 RepID=UPI0020C58EE4|nr:ensconsin isoform X10 [Rhipicephalus sanguineus]
MADDPQLASPVRNTSDSNYITKKSACNAPMAQKSPKQDTYWFAHAGGDAPSEDGTERRLSPDRSPGGESPQLSREERLRLVKVRQEEQRARRLQELEQQAQAAQHYRQQLEEERRRRIEEMRQRDHERRLQVEERKRLIWEADHERKEAMLKRNMERESKLDARRSTANRMSMSFAFGSSTPRTFDLDLATMSSAGAPVLMSAAPQRKSEERDFESSRKRAASAYNLCQAAATGKEQQSPSRPRSSMSVASEHSVASSQMSSSVVMRPRPPPRKPRPLSIAGTIPDKALQSRQNIPPEETVVPAAAAPVVVEKKKTAVPEVPPKPAHLRKPQKPQPPAASAFRRERPKDPVPASLPTAAVAPIVATAAAKPAAVAAATVTEPAAAPPDVVASNVVVAANQKQRAAESSIPEAQTAVAEQAAAEEVPTTTGPAVEPTGWPESCTQPATQGLSEPSSDDNLPSKPAPRVISEEEARALLAEKRRLAREQAEREAELERQRQEEIRRQEEERLRQEEEEQRRAEEEQLRLAEEFRRQEEEKLQRAIEEQQKREAEERERRELEAQQKAEREEQERKAREEAERQRKELEERLKREEAERAERKKRVEEIMSRTRRRGGKDHPAGKLAGSDAQASPERESSPSVSGRSSPQLPQDKSSDDKGTALQQEHKLEAAAREPEDAAKDMGSGEQQGGSLGNVAMPAAGSPDCVNGRETIVESADNVVDCSGDAQGDRGSSVVEEPMDQSPPQGKYFSPPSVASEGTTAPQPPCTNGYGHANGGGAIINGVGSEKVADLLGLDSPLKPEVLNTGSQDAENRRNSGDINSNRIVPTGNPLIGFEEDNRNHSTKTQEMQFTDLLS